MSDAPLLALPKKEIRTRGAIFSVLGAVVLALTLHDVRTGGTYHPGSMLICSLFCPMGLWMFLFPGEVDPATGRRSRKWEAGIMLCGVLGLALGVFTWWSLCGPPWAGL